jgi:hypothetical protein
MGAHIAVLGATMLEVEQAVAVALAVEAHQYRAAEQVSLVSAGGITGEFGPQRIGLTRLQYIALPVVDHLVVDDVIELLVGSDTYFVRARQGVVLQRTLD